ncbi:NHL repeat--containing protein [Acrasis kona]
MYTRFQTTIGINDTAVCEGQGAQVIYYIYLDDNLVYTSPVMHSGALFIDLDVTSKYYLDVNIFADRPYNNSCNAAMISDPILVPVLCFGIAWDDPSVCGGKGVCVSTNKCECKPSANSTCDYPKCFGLLYTDTNVCSGAGVCVDTDTCVCGALYSNNNCQDKICSPYNTTSYSPKSCVGYQYVSDYLNVLNPINTWVGQPNRDGYSNDINCISNTDIATCRFYCASDLNCKSMVNVVMASWDGGHGCW